MREEGQGRARRHRGAGFRTPPKVGAWLMTTEAGDRRRAARAPCRTWAAFRLPQRARFEVEILNLSAHGCAIRCETAHDAGAACWAILPTIESWAATVAWSDGSLTGLDFARPLHPAVAEMLVARASPDEAWLAFRWRSVG